LCRPASRSTRYSACLRSSCPADPRFDPRSYRRSSRGSQAPQSGGSPPRPSFFSHVLPRTFSSDAPPPSSRFSHTAARTSRERGFATRRPALSSSARGGLLLP
jgi:hypothetical protein